MLDGLTHRRVGGEGSIAYDTQLDAGPFGPIALSVTTTSPELATTVRRSGPCNSTQPGSFRLQLTLDLLRVDGAPVAEPGATGWDVWGRTPAWDTHLSRLPDGLSVGFSLDPAFVKGLSRSRDAALDALWGAALRMSFALAAPLADALLVHGAALVDPATGKAVLFVGPSGAGKTTMTRRLSEWPVIADDTFLVWRDGDDWYVSGTLLRGRERNAVTVGRFPVGALVALEPGAPDLSVHRASATSAFAELIARTFFYPSAFIPVDAQGLLVDIAQAMASAVPFFVLRSNLSHAIHDLGRTLEVADV